MPTIEALQPPSTFAPAAAELGIEFEPGDVEQLGRYLAILLETNKQFNLTAIKEPDEAWSRHILDSLTLIALLAELPKGARVIDVGSGGGLPGLPLAIVMPHLKFTLLEATGKKAEFLRTTIEALGLKNAAVLLGRAETVGQSGTHRERYDVAVARAVGPMAVIAELAVPLVSIGTEEAPGRVLLIKGQKAEEELAAAKQGLYELHVLHTGTVQTPTGRIVVLEKRRKTPAKYPRKDGEPKRAPLGG